jgi:ppGpp synthetase/RelA/SpoT-type nucleotidyltranferase
MDSIYGEYRETMEYVMQDMEARLATINRRVFRETGEHIYEHFSCRIKSEDSMREKCRRKGVPETPESALAKLSDAIGIRVICSFVDDIYKLVEEIRSFGDCTVLREKDYIRHAKDNGYRSYHMILAVRVPFPDVMGERPGTYMVEVQLRTIAMDTWASLEHRMKYKKNIPSQQLLVSELKRCADELASCDLSMQTIRDLIQAGE